MVTISKTKLIESKIYKKISTTETLNGENLICRKDLKQRSLLKPNSLTISLRRRNSRLKFSLKKP